MMRPFDELIAGLAALVPASASSQKAQLSLFASALEVEVPIESLVAGGLHASLPRGRLATGFDPPLGRVRARFEAEPA